MNRTPVQSGSIRDAAYDAESETLYLTFNSGSRYRYLGVEPKTFEDFMASDSKGKFFGLNIAGQYEADKVMGDDNGN